MRDYFDLLDKYFHMIFQETWWDGRRDQLVKEMDKIWDRLSSLEKEKCLEYNKILYMEKIR